MSFSYVDFAIASGIFLIFLSIIFSYLVNYIINYRNIAETSELRGIALIIFKTLFANEGLPRNWEEQNLNPVKIGLISKLYLVVINVTETSGNNRENVVINGSVEFDPNCERDVLNNTVRLYNSSNSQVPFKLYDQTFCDGVHIKKADIAFNSSLNSSQSKFFFLYFSSEKSVEAIEYLDFPLGENNYTFQTFPIQELQILSLDKLKALRNLSYEEVLQTIPIGYEFRVEIS